MSTATADRVLECALSHLGDGEQGAADDGEFVTMLRAGDRGHDQWSSEFTAHCLLRAGALMTITPQARRGAKRLARHLGRMGIGELVEHPVADMRRGDVICWHATDAQDSRAIIAIVDCYDPATRLLAVIVVVGRKGRRTVQRLVLHADNGAGWRSRLHSVHRPNYHQATANPANNDAKKRLAEIREAISFMRRRLESGQGDASSAMCRLSLAMAEDLLAMTTKGSS